MKEILKKEQELNQLNKEIEESLQRLEENNSYENYEKHKELLERRKQSFKELNDMGNTIVMITHDLNVAKSAGRIVHIIDGELTDEASVNDMNKM